VPPSQPARGGSGSTQLGTPLGWIWFFDGGTPSDASGGFRLSEPSALVFDALARRVGAVVAGRNTYRGLPTALESLSGRTQCVGAGSGEADGQSPGAVRPEDGYGFALVPVVDLRSIDTIQEHVERDSAFESRE
jgi:hypothetical protein